MSSGKRSDSVLKVLKSTRLIYTMEIVEILKRSHRKLSDACEVISSELLREDTFSMQCGRGYVIILTDRPHAVSVYRCMDGTHLYYDPTGRQPVHRHFQDYLLLHNIPDSEVRGLYRKLQTLATCAYHAITFLDVASASEFIWSLKEINSPWPRGHTLKRIRKYVDVEKVWKLVKVDGMTHSDAIVHLVIDYLTTSPDWIPADIRRVPDVVVYLSDLIVVHHVKKILKELRPTIKVRCGVKMSLFKIREIADLYRVYNTGHT